MRILLLANGSVGLATARFLHARGEDIVGLALHAPAIRREGEAILSTLDWPENQVLRGDHFRDAAVIEQIRQLRPDIIVCAFWAYILRPEVLAIPTQGCINFHPGYLPFCRGKNPNVWPFLEGSPAGVTIHWVDEGIDTGDIIARREVPIQATDTAGPLYERTLTEIVDLFEATWPAIRSGSAPRLVQADLPESPTCHRGAEIDEVDRIDLDAPTTARDLIQRLRSRSYGKRSFAFFEEHGRRTQIGVFLHEPSGS